MAINLGRIAGLLSAGALVIVAVGAAASGQGTRPDVEGYSPSSYPESYGGAFYPATELRALPPARAQAVAARAELRRAENALTVAVEDVRRGFNHAADFNQALAEEHDAYAALEAARQDVVASLKKDPLYQTAQLLRARLAKQIELRQDTPENRVEEMIALASVKLSYAATATAMEAAAIAAEPRVTEARQRLVAAGKRVSELRWQLDDAVRKDPAVLAARKTVADARITALASDALYAEAHDVADVALDYAYFLRRYPYPYIINAPYSGFPYGYGSAYQIGYPIGYPYTWGSPARTTR